jgi:hypothetical protein
VSPTESRRCGFAACPQFGYHYSATPPHRGRHSRPFSVDMHAFYSRMTTHLSHPERLLLMRSTLVQHFHTSSGEYLDNPVSGTCSAIPEGQPKQWLQTLPQEVALEAGFRNLLSGAPCPPLSVRAG